MLTSTIKRSAFAILGLVASFTFTSCDKETEPSYATPTTYNFANVSYSGQEQRIAMLSEIDTYIKTGNNGVILNAQKMKNMYANANAPFADASLNTSSKQLKDKTVETFKPVFDGYFDAVATASLSAGTPATNGIAGILTSTTDPSKKYLVDSKGVEHGQVISKGLMGAVFYFQSVEGYLTTEKIGASVDNTNVTPGQGTKMEHHWDEAFGYFGAPKDFPTNTTGIKYWANYSNKVNLALGSNKLMMDAFLKGRAAISAKDMKSKDAAAATLRTEWERLVAASAIYELNAAKAKVADQALKSHYLSEAIGFVMGLKFKTDRKLTDAQYNNVMTKIGFSTNLYNTTAADIDEAIKIISAAYNMDAIKDQLK
jgi:hypothetical protein